MAEIAWSGLVSWPPWIVHALSIEAACSAVLAVIVWSLLRLCPRASAATRLALWTLVFVRLLVPAGWGHPLTVRAALERIPVARLGSDRSDVRAEPAIDISPGGAEPAVESEPLRSGPALPAILLGLWLSGTLIALAGHASRAHACRLVARRGSAVLDPRAAAALHEWRSRFRIRRTVRLVATTDGSPPFTIGILRPVVVVPRELLEPGWASSLGPVIAHELAHVRRLDAVWIAIEQVVRAVYFFNPAAWLAARETALARECLCDAMVVSAGDISPRRYGRTLVAVLRADFRRDPSPVAGMSAVGRMWMARLRHLSAARVGVRGRRVRACAAALVVGLAVLPMGPPAAEPYDDSNRPGAGPSSAWRSDRLGSSPSTGTPRFRSPLPGAHEETGFGLLGGSGDRAREYHAGLDLAATPGAPVLAAADGVVKIARRASASRAGLVILSHGPRYTTSYLYVGDVHVSPGARVSAGQQVAALPPQGASIPRHLHFQINVDGQPSDPRPLIRPRR